MLGMTASIKGIIERVTFHNPENGFAVLRVAVPGEAESVTVTGSIGAAYVGESIHAVGEWVRHRDHGRQFKAVSLQTEPPTSVDGVKRFLASGLIRGIGAHFAQRIVERFGTQTLRIIDESPQFLSEIRGIGPKRIQQIRQSWQEQKAVRDIVIFLQSFGIGTARALRIHKTYGEQAIAQIRANPYRLCADVWGIGFPTADQLALKMGFERKSLVRAQAAIRHVLREAQDEGHVACPQTDLVAVVEQLTQIPVDVILQALEQSVCSREVVRDAGPSEAQCLSSAGAVPTHEPPALWIYPSRLFHAECHVARRLVLLKNQPHPLATAPTDSLLEMVQRNLGIDLAPQQKLALERAGREKVLIVTGGPGVGKTTIVRGIREMFVAWGRRVALCAPTGRAARRLSEATGAEAKTIHRLLEFDAAAGRFRYDEQSPLDVDLVIVDEVSMVDLVLMHQLLQALPLHACLVMVGDANQLPSVGPGNVLHDLIASQQIPVVRLTEIFRQAASSYIVRAAHAVLQGQLPNAAPAPQGDFFVVEAAAQDVVLERIVTMIQERIPERFGLNPIRDVQVLTPMNRTPLGATGLNQRLQMVLNPSHAHVPEVQRFGTTFRVGDKVMQVRNNYQREVFNGDVGIVSAINAIDQEVKVEFDGREVAYDFSDLDELTLAYACTIHKSQGSEFPAVVIPWHTVHYVMLQRNLLYTAITRGRRLVVLVGNRQALSLALRQADALRRCSRLAVRVVAASES
jgi:exodeoxyribonuclease V alpha subunit